MEKQNDYFLNLLSNPTFSAKDFMLVGLSVNNTSIQDKNFYLNSDYIKDLDVFKTNGTFDLSKFDNFYDYAKMGFTDLAKLQEADDLGETWMAYRGDISMPETLRDQRPLFKIEKVKNPLKLQTGLVTFGITEDPTRSEREIAQTQKTWNPETNLWEDSPNDSWFSNFYDTKVLATWEEDGTHIDPISGESVQHRKGEKKLNYNGNYYYEKLGDKSVYGKEVLTGFDTLTTDGTFWNKLDFLDSDDLEKSFGGSLMRTAALIVPAFIPGVGEWYITARVGLGLSLILPAFGKTFLGSESTLSPILNRIEALDKTLSFSQSDYVRGSLTPTGETLQDLHFWSWETGLKLVADVFTQLAEQRWMFEKTSSIFSGLNKKVISSQEEQAKWIENYIAEHSNKAETVEDILKGISKGLSPELRAATLQSLRWAEALNVLKNKLKGALELGGKLSTAYMVGITTANSYGEAKLAGATDLEAALFTLGYTLGEWKLLRSELGLWILPELKSELRHTENVIKTAMPKIKLATKEAQLTSEIGKVKWYTKIMNIGKDAYNNNLGKGIASETIGSAVSNMTSEALEETSEELLLDLAKVIFNAATSLGSNAKFDDAFKNVFDRYAMSFIGGAVGGGIAGTLPAYRSARLDRNLTLEMATKELVDLVQQNKDKELLEIAYKMNFGNKYLDEEGNQVSDETKSQDFMIKKNFTRLILDIKDILTVNGADLDKESLVHQLEGGKDTLKYAMLSNLASQKSNSIIWYLNRYNDLSSLLVEKSLELKDLQRNKTDKEGREENSDDKAKETLLLKEIKEIKEELDKFKDGTMSDEFILDALFEMDSKISSYYHIPSDPKRWIEENSKKPYDELTEKEKIEWELKFKDEKPLLRDLNRLARQVHIKNMESLTKVIEEYLKNYFGNKQSEVDNLAEILLLQRRNFMLEEETLIPNLENYVVSLPDTISALLWNFETIILSKLDKSKSLYYIDELDRISKMPTTLTSKIGIKALPTTLELLKSLDEETKRKIFKALEYGSEDLEDLIDAYTEELETGEKVLSSKFNEDVKNSEKILNEVKSELFGRQLISLFKNKEVKEEIIKRLSSAKYILPTVKLALTDFFTSKVAILDEETSELVLQDFIPKKDLEDYLNAFKNAPSSPVDEYLNNITTTLRSKGIEISPVVANMEELISKLAKARSLNQFSYDDTLEKIIDDALNIIDLAEVGLESAATTINGDLSDIVGFNVAVNEIREKRGKNIKKLAEIPADIAEGIKLDIQRYKLELLLFKSLLAINSNAILNEHDETFKILTINFYDAIKSFVNHLEPPEDDDWKGIKELKQIVDSSSLKELSKEDKISLEYKNKLTAGKLAIDKALYNFFLKNSDKLRNFKSVEDREKAVEMISHLIKDFKILFKFDEDTTTPLNAAEKSFGLKDLLWYLASMAAADPEAILNEYSLVLSAEYAPVIGLEEAIKLALTFLVDPKIFKLFADAYNLTMFNNFSKEELVSKGSYTYVNAYRSIFIEGFPGSGKSSAVLKTLTDILNKFHPKALENIVIVSNSESNAETLKTNLLLPNAQHFGIEQFRKKVINNYIPLSTNSNGLLELKAGKDVTYDAERKVNIYKEGTPNANALNMSLLIIDEATSLSQMDAALLDDLMEEKGIYGIYAGDFDLIGSSGSITSEEKNDKGKYEKYSVTLDNTNYISTHKLGLAIRGNNNFKTANILGFRLNKYLFIDSLRLGSQSSITLFSYYEDDSGLYGDVVTKADSKTDTSGVSYMLDKKTKEHINIMVKTLNEGEKINYIYDDDNSELYKYLEENYKDKINKISTKAAQSLEGLYYIVDIHLEDKLNGSIENIVKATDLFKTLYTAISRAKLATLIYESKGTSVINDRIKSSKTNKLIKTNIGLEARRKYTKERIESIKAALGEESNKTLKLNWEPEKFEVKTNPITEEPPVEEPPIEEDTEDVETLNLLKDIDIDNSNEATFTTMIHSFASNECGGTIDDNELIVLDEDYKFRTDGVNGIIKILNIQTIQEDDKQKLSLDDTQKVLTLLHGSRTAGLYEKSNLNIVSKIKKVFGLKAKDTVTVNFIYKNTQKEPPKEEYKGPINKFFGRLKDKILYILSDNPPKEVITPHNRIFALEIFINGKLLEVPVGIFTNPITLLETKGFEKLKEFYNNLLTKTLISFHELLLKAKLNGENIPQMNNMLKFLELYQWNYNHSTNLLNFVVRLNKNFVLNTGKITGVQTPPRKRGEHYSNLAYYYEGKPTSLIKYKQRFKDRKVGGIFQYSEDIKDCFGKIAIRHNSPFVLVSDYYSNDSGRQLLQKYIEQINNPDAEPLITRVYINIPKESLDYFLYNLQEALKRTHKQESDETEDLDQLSVDDSIGNMLTSYRLLLFMTEEDSSYSKAFEKWISNNSDSDEQKELSRMRFNKIKELVEYLTLKEKELKENPNLGSKAKLMLLYLNTPADKLSQSEKKFFIEEGLWFIGNPKWTLRTILLYEFRKLLFSEKLFQSRNQDGKLSSLSLSYQDIEITKKDLDYIYKDFLQDRINALREDMMKHKWDGIMFHTSLLKEGEITVSHSNKSYTFLRINAEESSYISGHDIMINSKLDTSACVIDVLPVINEILSKLVIITEDKKKNTKTITGSSMTLNKSEAKKEEIYNENTKAYLGGVENIEKSSFQLFLENCQKHLSSNSNTKEIINKIEEYAKKEGTSNINFNDDFLIFKLLTNIFNEPLYIILYQKGKFEIKDVNAEAILAEILTKKGNVETYYLKNNNIYKASDESSITPHELNNLSLELNFIWKNGGLEIVNNLISSIDLSLNVESDLQILGKEIFGENFDINLFKNFKNLENFLKKTGIIVLDGITLKTDYDFLKFIGAFGLRMLGYSGNKLKLGISSITNLKELLEILEIEDETKLKLLYDIMKKDFEALLMNISCTVFDK